MKRQDCYGRWLHARAYAIMIANPTCALSERSISNILQFYFWFLQNEIAQKGVRRIDTDFLFGFGQFKNTKKSKASYSLFFALETNISRTSWRQ